MKFSKLSFIILHLCLGLLSFYVPGVTTIWAYFFIFYSIDRILRYRNSDGWAAVASAYIVGFEVLCRMSGASIFYEYVKYATVLFLIIGMIVERDKKKLYVPGLMYFLLLLPSVAMCYGIDFNTFRNDLSFNLSGPLCLSVSCIYFARRKLSIQKIEQIFFNFILPVLAMVVWIILRMPSFEKIGFNLSSNKALSGGFGPNQVAAILGFAFLLVGVAWLLKFSFTFNSLTDRIIGFVCMSYAVLTFSRGGVLTPIAVLIIGFYISAKESGNIKQFLRLIQVAFFIILASFFIFSYLDKITGNTLSGRYEKSLRKRQENIPTLNPGEENAESSTQVGLDLSGREVIFMADIAIFMQYPIMGVGPGMGYKLREKYVGVPIAAHTEFSRMLAEHGLYGAVSLIVLIMNPFIYYQKKKNVEGKIFVICFALFSLFTTLHTATRIGLTAFSYGLAFLEIEDKKHSLERLLPQ